MKKDVVGGVAENFILSLWKLLEVVVVFVGIFQLTSASFSSQSRRGRTTNIFKLNFRL